MMWVLKGCLNRVARGLRCYVGAELFSVMYPGAYDAAEQASIGPSHMKRLSLSYWFLQPSMAMLI